MKKEIVSALFLIAFYCIQTDAKSLKPVCPIEGQVFQECRTCPATCEDPDLLCTLQCQPGCGCPSGQLIDGTNNRCVDPKQCPAPEPECPIEGQVFQECRTCPATCEDPDLLCTLQCQPGCGCPPGQLIDGTNNRCVDPKRCPAPEPGCPDGSRPVYCFVDPCDPRIAPTCEAFPDAVCISDYCGGCNARFFVGKREVTDMCSGTKLAGSLVCPIAGQVFQECRTCPATCEEPDLACPDVCREGCGCPFGKVIDEATNSCVDPQKCKVSLN